jgi:hypothetical protein
MANKGMRRVRPIIAVTKTRGRLWEKRASALPASTAFGIIADRFIAPISGTSRDNRPESGESDRAEVERLRRARARKVAAASRPADGRWWL